MHDVRALLDHGFRTWRENLNTCVPFIFRIVLMAVVVLVAMIPLIILGIFQLSSIPGLGSLGLTPSAEMVTGSIAALLFTVLIIAVVLAAIAIYSYFQAGAIGMSREALEKGSTSLDTMWSAGRSHYIGMAVVNLIIGLIAMAVIFVGFLVFLSPMMMLAESGAFGWLTILLGWVVLVMILIILVLSLTMAPFALVIDGQKPVEAIKMSFDFFMSHKADVFFVGLAVFGVSLIVGIIGAALGATDSMYIILLWSIIGGILNQVIIPALSTVWWAGLYMDRTGKLLYEEAA